LEALGFKVITPPLTGFDGYGVGIVCGRGDYPIIAVDIDITDPALSEKMRGYVATLTGTSAPYRVGNAPKCIIVCRTAKTTMKNGSRKYGCGRVEILGLNCQFVAAGIHPVTEKEYEWPDKSIFEIPASELPLLTDGQIKQIIHEFESLAESRGMAPIPSKTKSDNTARKRTTRN